MLNPYVHPHGATFFNNDVVLACSSTLRVYNRQFQLRGVIVLHDRIALLTSATTVVKETTPGEDAPCDEQFRLPKHFSTTMLVAVTYDGTLYTWSRAYARSVTANFLPPLTKPVSIEIIEDGLLVVTNGSLYRIQKSTPLTTTKCDLAAHGDQLYYTKGKRLYSMECELYAYNSAVALLKAASSLVFAALRSGEIVVYDYEERCVVKRVHWHASSPTALCIQRGVFYSGGAEGVLMKHERDQRVQKRGFGPIDALCVGGSSLCVLSKYGVFVVDALSLVGRRIELPTSRVVLGCGDFYYGGALLFGREEIVAVDTHFEVVEVARSEGRVAVLEYRDDVFGKEARVVEYDLGTKRIRRVIELHGGDCELSLKESGALRSTQRLFYCGKTLCLLKDGELISFKRNGSNRVKYSGALCSCPKQSFELIEECGRRAVEGGNGSSALKYAVGYAEKSPEAVVYERGGAVYVYHNGLYVVEEEVTIAQDEREGKRTERESLKRKRAVSFQAFYEREFETIDDALRVFIECVGL